MERGFVKLWRKSLDGGLLKNHRAWVFWSWCLMKASHKKHKQVVGYQVIDLEPGQFIFGRKVAAEELGMSEQNIRTVVDFMVKSKNLTIKTTNKFSIVSIINWDTYQSQFSETNQQTNQQLTNNQPTTNQQLTTNKKGKNGKNEKKEPYTEKTISKNGVPYKEIIDHLNQKSKKNFRPGSKVTQGYIKARWNEGFILDDFKKVINAKCTQWLNDPKMVDFLRPETLFGTKFEAYLNTKTTEPQIYEALN